MIAILSALLMQAAAPDAGIVDTTREQDLRCLVAISAALPQLPAEQRASVQALAMYYVGRIDAREPSFDYEGAMAALVAETSLDRMRDDMTRCGTQMEARGRALTALGNALQRRGERQGKSK